MRFKLSFLRVVRPMVFHRSTTPTSISSTLPLTSRQATVTSRRHLSTRPQVTPEEVKDILRKTKAVCFDVDSTVSMDEGIDVLAEFAGCGQAVTDLTKRAMGGKMSFEEALNARLNLIQPSYQMIEACLEAHPPKLTPHISDLINSLHNRGILVYLVSGGFHQMIRPIADQIGVPYHRIYANNILFDGQHGRGDYLCYDKEQYTCRDGGKGRVIHHLKTELGLERVVMIGDGVTDMEAKPPADAFIGYGGIVIREPVRDGADWFVTDFQDLLQVLDSPEDHQVQVQTQETPAITAAVAS